ncbi:MAG: hypothetical protein VXW65_02400, partial [Pseudomonadota bacterium]|nr:hypothetical protein [Pseudomonadota bacterium]
KIESVNMWNCLIISSACAVWLCLSLIYANGAALLAITGLYAFLKRIHSVNQQRAIKSLNDELIKTNDFFLEFLIMKNQENELDAKTKLALEIAQKKTLNHIDYLELQIFSFPYGGPVTSLFLMHIRIDKSPRKRKADELFFDYQSSLTDETPLQNHMLDGFNVEKLIDRNLLITKTIMIFFEEEIKRIF